MFLPIDKAHNEYLESVKKEETIRDPEILLQEHNNNQLVREKEYKELEYQKHEFARMVKGVDIIKEVNDFKKKNNTFWHRLKVVFGITQ
jgi:hypothetical protein